MIEIREELDARGRSRFGIWFAKLDPAAAAKVTTALYRLTQGNTSNAKSVGGGVSEVRIDFGPGYRVYFAWAGPRVAILLGGGTKKRQSESIAAARAAWVERRRRDDHHAGR